ncbi:polysaccharide pyruvyl transferase family protein [Bacillaceae bacterium S4-13-58]
MTIGIVGNYGNNNKGDEAILEGILLQLQKVFKVSRDEIIVFSNQPDQTSKSYGVKSERLYHKKKSAYLTMLSTMRANYSTIKKLDMLIVGGGGIFMDLYGREAFLFGMYGWLAKLSRTPVVLYGAGPILTKVGKILLRSLANLSEIVTVRDPKSKELLKSIGVKSEIHVIGDPAFEVPMPATTQKRERPLQIGVTAVPFHHGSYWPEENVEMYQNYVLGMARNLDALVEKYPDVQINFFSTKYPQDVWVSEEVKSKMTHSDHCRVQNKVFYPEDIVKFTAEQDIVIGTRLHSLILALVSETPVIAVAYHHKVKDFMDMIGSNDHVIVIDQLNKEDDFFVCCYEQMANDWPATLERYQTIANTMKHKAHQGMVLVNEHIQAKKKQKSQVLVLSNMYPSTHSKTFGIFVKNQVEQLRNQGLKVDTIAITDPRKGKSILLKKYLGFFLRGLARLIARGWRYQVVHAHYIFPTGLIGLAYKFLLRKKLIVTSHGGDIDQMVKKSGWARKLSEMILQKADHIIAVGDRLKQDIVDNFDVPANKVSVINMGVNRDVFKQIEKSEARSKLGLSADGRILLFVGNLIFAKGLSDLGQAMLSLKETDPDVTLHLIGEAKDRNYIEKFKAEFMGEGSANEINDPNSPNGNRNGGNIVIHDAMDQSEVAVWLSAADLFILPSHIEGFGLVALEAMSCGTPVVGTDVGGLTYLLDGEAGLKVEPKNPTSLAKGIRSLLHDPERQEILRTNGFKKAEENDQNQLIQEILKIYGI